MRVLIGERYCEHEDGGQKNEAMEEDVIQGMKEAQARHMSGGMLPAEIAEQYRELNTRPTQLPGYQIGNKPSFDPIPTQRIVRGAVLATGVIGGGYIIVTAVVAIASAVVVFVETNAMVIGGGVAALFVMMGLSGSRGATRNPTQSGNITNVYNNTVIFNQGQGGEKKTQ